jgi:AcrR family transcriptional regulator
MSRVRTRPPREETRQRLFEAAALIFEREGIGAASVESISAAAGYSRGAFYSNFASKDDLISSMLSDHVEQSAGRYVNLLVQHPDPADFVNALVAADRSTQDPLGRSPLLHIELVLYCARSAEKRPELIGPLRARRKLTAALVRATVGDFPLDPEQAGAMLLAMEDGFRLHRLIDPQTTPPDAFVRAVKELQRALRHD